MDFLRTAFERVLGDPWLRAAAITVGAFFAAFLIDWIINRVLRVATRRTSTMADDQLLAMFHRPVQVTVVLIGLFIAVKQLDFAVRFPRLGPDGEVLADAMTWEEIVRAILLTIAVVVWTVFALRLCAFLLRAFSTDTRRFQFIEPTTLPLFQNLAKVVLIAVGVYILILTWQADVTGFIASAGIAGIAIGFAAKDTLSNLFAGVFILVDAPYRRGDFIVLDSGERGEVVDIGLRSTRLLTRDDIEITIPNAVMGQAKILNETGGKHAKRRVRIQVGVAYGSDVDHVRQSLMDVAAAEEMACGDPTPRVRFRRFGDSALDFELLCWIPEPVYRGRAVDALLTGVYKRFAAEGIEIAFPQMDVHLHRTGEGTD